jgi:hypothetical protein
MTLVRGLAKQLQQRTRRLYKSVSVNFEKPADAFAEIDAALDEMDTKDVLAHLREHVMKAATWLYDDDVTAAHAALQDLLPPQVPDLLEECADCARSAEAPAAVALQDLLNAESLLLAGLVAHLFQPALQDDMASTTRRLVQLGRDVINGRCGEGHQAITSAREAALGPRAVQVG